MAALVDLSGYDRAAAVIADAAVFDPDGVIGAGLAVSVLAHN